MAFQFPPLPYKQNALEPSIDTLAVEIHYTKHHVTYLNNLNAALERYPQFANPPIEKLRLVLHWRRLVMVEEET